MEESHRKVLQSGGLQAGVALESALHAARALDTVFNTYNAMNPGTQEMRSVMYTVKHLVCTHILAGKRWKSMESSRLISVTDYTIMCENYSSNWYAMCSSHDLQSMEAPGTSKEATWSAESHLPIFKPLNPYKELIHWFKKMEEPSKFEKLVQTYTHFVRGVYKKEIKTFFEKVQNRILNYVKS